MQPLRRTHYQQLVLWLAVATVMLRAMIPDGFMPEREVGRSGLTLVFCSAGPLARLGSSAALAVDSEFGKQAGSLGSHSDSDHSTTQDHSVCAFASATSPGLPFNWHFYPHLRHDGHAAFGPLGFIAESAKDYLRPPLRGPPRFS